jgi:hypothetical protein
MPIKITKAIKDELKELDIDLMDYREVVLCPYCFEVHEEDSPATAIEAGGHLYGCSNCGLIVSLQ